MQSEIILRFFMDFLQRYFIANYTRRLYYDRSGKTYNLNHNDYKLTEVKNEEKTDLHFVDTDVADGFIYQ